MKKTLLLILIFSLAVASCSVMFNEETAAASAADTANRSSSASDDLVYSNGVLYSGSTPIAVVAFEDEHYRYGVSLKASDTADVWSKGDEGYYSEIICEVIDAEKRLFSGDIDGSDNFSVIASYDWRTGSNLLNHYPPYYFVKNYAINNNLPVQYRDGWYLPSIYEIFKVYDSRSAIKKAFDDAEIQTNLFDVSKSSSFNGFWSSSQSKNDNKLYMCSFPHSLSDDVDRIANYRSYYNNKVYDKLYSFAMRKFPK